MTEIKLKVTKVLEGAHLPMYSTEHSAGLDIYAMERVDVFKNKVTSVRTGIAVEIPEGYVGLLVIRSSLGKKGIDLANSVGIIDSDYRGELFIKLTNHGELLARIEKNSRIAQLVILPLPRIKVIETKKLHSTKRGSGGFGSTGK